MKSLFWSRSQRMPVRSTLLAHTRDRPTHQLAPQAAPPPVGMHNDLRIGIDIRYRLPQRAKANQSLVATRLLNHPAVMDGIVIRRDELIAHGCLVDHLTFLVVRLDGGE